MLKFIPSFLRFLLSDGMCCSLWWRFKRKSRKVRCWSCTYDWRWESGIVFNLMAFRVFIISSWSIVYPLTLCPDISLKISRLREGLGVATNNVAEYRGLILGLKYAIRLGFKRIKVYGDSQLVCYQVHAYKLVLSEWSIYLHFMVVW
jgi:hypothetical protein